MLVARKGQASVQYNALSATEVTLSPHGEPNKEISLAS